MFPRFRIVAVSMKRLQIGVARIAAIPIDMIHLNPVVMLEEQPTVATAPVLHFEQLGQSRTGVRMPSLSCTPVHPIAIVRAAVASHLDVPRDRHLTMGEQVHGVGHVAAVAKASRLSTRCQYRFFTQPPVFLGCRRCAQLRSFSQVRKSSRPKAALTHAGAVISCPAANFRVELMDQGTLR